MRHAATNAELPPSVRQGSTGGNARLPGPQLCRRVYSHSGGGGGHRPPLGLQSNGRQGLLPPCRPSDTRTAPPPQALGATNANPRGAAWNRPASLQTSGASRPRRLPRRHPLPAETRRWERRDSLPPPPRQRESFNGRLGAVTKEWERPGETPPWYGGTGGDAGKSARGSVGSKQQRKEAFEKYPPERPKQVILVRSSLAFPWFYTEPSGTAGMLLAGAAAATLCAESREGRKPSPRLWQSKNVSSCPLPLRCWERSSRHRGSSGLAWPNPRLPVTASGAPGLRSKGNGRCCEARLAARPLEFSACQDAFIRQNHRQLQTGI